MVVMRMVRIMMVVMVRLMEIMMVVGRMRKMMVVLVRMIKIHNDGGSGENDIIMTTTGVTKAMENFFCLMTRCYLLLLLLLLLFF